MDDGQRLFTVRTGNAGNALKQAIRITQDPVLMTRLNNAISPSDAHAIDVRYHKLCWTNHVFRVLRDDVRNQATPATAYLPIQMPCLIELINIVDIQTQHKAYLPMDAIETTYISMLGGSDEAEKHKTDFEPTMAEGQAATRVAKCDFCETERQTEAFCSLLP